MSLALLFHHLLFNIFRIMKRKRPKDVTIRCLLLTSVSTCFGHHYAHLQEKKGPVTAFGLYWSVTSGKKDVMPNVFSPLVTDQYTPNAVTESLFS